MSAYQKYLVTFRPATAMLPMEVLAAEVRVVEDRVLFLDGLVHDEIEAGALYALRLKYVLTVSVDGTIVVGQG